MPAYDPQRTRRRPVTDDAAPAPVDALLEPVPVAPAIVEATTIVDEPVALAVTAPSGDSGVEAAVEDLVVPAPKSPSIAPVARRGGVDKRLLLAGAAVLAVLALVVLGRRRRD